MSRYETNIWTPEEFYPVPFSKGVVGEYSGISQERSQVDEIIERYRRAKEYINLPPKDRGYARLDANHPEVRLVEDFEANPVRPIPEDTLPLLEYVAFGQTPEDAPEHGLAGVGIRIPGGDWRYNHLVMVPFLNGELDVADGKILWSSNPRFRPVHYLVRRVGYCIPVDEQ